MNSNAIFQAFHTLVELFEGPLAHARFPGVDGEVLRTHQAEVNAADIAVRQAEEALAQARAQLQEKVQVATDRAERALSYLRVFAADDATVAEAIADVSFARPAEPARLEPARRRGRPRKSESSELFTDMAAPETSGEEQLEATA